jgi:predicted DsbA family dithiol-disulfide isomerase
MPKLRIDVWSDIACPWCYVGKRRLEQALADFPHADEVELVWRSFELDPGAPAERDPSVPHVQRIAQKYGMSVEQASRNNARLVQLALAEGLHFDFDHLRSGNTFDAHRLVHFAKTRGLQDAMKERLLRAYFEEGALMSDHATLARLAADAGLEEAAAIDVLSSEQYAQEVRQDEEQARQLEITGVPCFVFDSRLAVSGAQSPQVMLSALHQAWAERDAARAAFEEGAVCGPDGC